MKFAQNNTETINYNKKVDYFLRKYKLYGWITREFFRLGMGKFQGFFHDHKLIGGNFTSTIVHP